jgi:integrase/recombinase XerD
MVKIHTFFYTSKTRIKNHGVVYFRVRGIDRDVNVSTGVIVHVDDWDSKKRVVKSKHAQSYILNKQIEEVKTKIYDFIEDKIRAKETTTYKSLRDHLDGKEEVRKGLIGMIGYYIEHNRNRLAHKTLKKYTSTYNKLKKYVNEVLQTTDIPIESLNYRFICDLNNFLESVCKNTLNTIDKDIKLIKSAIHLGQKLDIIKDNPLKSYQSKTTQTKRSILTLEEIQKIEHLEIESDVMKYVRDGFMIMCFTGLSFSDFERITHKDIQLGITGQKIIRMRRKKTDEYCMVPIIKKVEDIIDSYKNNPIVLRTGKIIPSISNQRMNGYLKVIAESAGISKRVTCHVARHSFATNSLELNVPIETVSKVLGHANIKTTQIYAKITEKKLLNDFSGFEQNYNNNKSFITKAI